MLTKTFNPGLPLFYPQFITIIFQEYLSELIGSRVDYICYNNDRFHE